MEEPKQDIIHNEVRDSSPPSPIEKLDTEGVKGQDFTLAQSELPKGYFRSLNFLGSMLAVGGSFGAGVGGFGLVAPVLGYINADVGPSPNITWVALSYLLTSSVGLVLFGRVTDIFGRRWFFIGGSALATVGSIVCATATSVNGLIAGETLLGLAAAAQLNYSFAISELVPMDKRFLAQAWVCTNCIPTSGFAPVIAYAFVFQSKVGWRGIFYLLTTLNAASTLCWLLFYRPPNFQMKHSHGRKMQYIKEFDYIGTVLATAGLLLFLMGISWGGGLYPWKSAHVIATIIIGVLLMVAFVLWEVYMPLKEPLVPMHLFKNRTWNVCIILWALGAAVYYSLAILWPSMVATLYSQSHGIMWAGWASCLSNCGILFGEFWVPIGALFPRKTTQIAVSFAVGSAFVASVASCTPDTPVRAMILVFLGAAFIGFNEIGCSVVSTIAIEDQREIGTAVGVASSLRSAISTFCSTVFTTVLANRLAKTIPENVLPALINAGLPASSVPSFLQAIATGTQSAFTSVEGLTPAIQAAGVRAYQVANSEAYKTVFLVGIAFSAIGVIVSLFYGDIDHLLTKEVTIQIHEKGNEQILRAVDQEMARNQSRV